jgi:methyl-accepting chemotaxis protein
MKMPFGLRSVAAKVNLLIVVLIVINISVCTWFILDHFSTVLGTDRLKQNLKAAELIVNPDNGAFTVGNGELRLGSRVLNGDTTSVDAVVSAFGGLSTIFLGDTRIATNLKTADGRRAVGTKLARGPIYDTVLKNGQPYFGTATALGKNYVAAYEPLKDAGGHTVGILFVGFEQGEFNKTFVTAVVLALIAGLIQAAVCGGIGSFILRRLLAPFKPLGKLMEEAQSGRYTENVPYVGRRDEFGGLAKVILEFNRTMKKQEEMRAANEAAKIKAAEEQKRAEAEALRQGEALVVDTFGEGLKALADENLSYRLVAEVPPAYLALKDDFNHAIETSEHNRNERVHAAKQHEADRIAAEAAQKKAEEAAHHRSVELVTSSFGEALAALARRELTYRMKIAMPDEYRILQDDFNNAISQLDDAMRDIDARATDIAANATQINQASQEMAQRTERQAAALEQTAAAVTQITSNVGKSAENAKSADNTAKGAQGDAERGNEVAKQSVEAMHQIAQSSKQITEIIGVMDEIAFQTNLLAINAAVEAAHAGDAGKGFAVVAIEVRTLAQRSAEAAKQIKSLIRTSEEQVGQGVKLVEESGTALAKIAEDVGVICSLMDEIAAAQREQATGLGEIDSAVNQMDQTTQQNAAMAEESNAASDALASHARELATLVDRFATGKKETAAPAQSLAA